MLLAASRFVHYTAICLLFGLSAFPFYAEPDRKGASSYEGTLRTCAVFALLTGVIALAAMIANMGGSLTSIFDPQVISAAVGNTTFGRVWVGRLLLAVVALVLCLRRRPGRSLGLVIVSGLLPASVALTGHSSMPGGWMGGLHQVADAAHLLAAGWWVGGLLALVLATPTLGDRTPEVLSRFSGVGYAAVALIVATGVLKSVILLGSVAALVSTSYGRVLLIKLGLFGLMGLLALSNRFQVTPALERGSLSLRWARRLRSQVGVEFGLGLAVLAVVGALGAMQPPISQ